MVQKTNEVAYDMSGRRIGSPTAYTDFSTTGRQTMATTARVLKSIFIPATDWYGQVPNMWVNTFNANVSSATCTSVVLPRAMAFGNSGSNPSVPVLSCSATCGLDARAATMFLAPSDADTSGSVAVKLYYTTRVAMGESGCSQSFRVHGAYLGSGGSPEVGNSTSLLKGGSMDTAGNGFLEVLTIGSLPSFNRSSSPFVLLQLSVENSNASSYVYHNDSGSAEEAIFGMELIYTANSLGTVSSE